MSNCENQVTTELPTDSGVLLGQYRARIQVMKGNRFVSGFLAACDLGITAAAVPEVMTITWKPGEVVDHARITDVMERMIRQSNAERTPFVIHSWSLLELVLLP